MKHRMLVMALSVVLALVVVTPIASAQDSSGDTPEPSELTAAWWSWAFQDPSPLEGSYKGGEKCEGEYVEGVFFLAGAAPEESGSVPKRVERTCTVPAKTPILFPVVNALCSEVTGDTEPYDECATWYADETVDPPSKWYAKLDGKNLKRQRIASGLFDWTIEWADNPYGLPTGTYEAGSDGLWVFREKGLKAGKHTITFGGTYKDTPFGDFEGTRVIYKLKVQ